MSIAIEMLMILDRKHVHFNMQHGISINLSVHFTFLLFLKRAQRAPYAQPESNRRHHVGDPFSRPSDSARQ